MARFTSAGGGSGSGSPGPQGPAGNNGANGPQGETGPAGDPFGIYYLGNYVSTNGYITDIAVVRGSDGQLYLAKASGQLGDPIDYQSNGQWEVWIPKGADGSDGAAGADGDDALWNFTGEWVNGVDYGPGSVVEFQGSCYYHPNGQFSSYAPPTNGWLLVASKGDQGIQGETGPQGEPGLDADVSFQSVRWTPNFTATGLTFTGTGATHPTYNSHYVKQGQLVSFWIAVDCSTVTSFGTGQLNLQLPFAPLAGSMNHFSGWVFVDETANPDLAGHIIVNADHLPNTQTIDLHYIKQQGGANSPVMEAILKQNTPVVLTTATNIYVNGTYISA